MMYKALGYEPPEYVHHPMLVGADRAKLSKRHGSVSLLEYREKGYLPEAMFNFLALMGWSLDDKTEIMTRRQLIDNFSFERIGKTGAFFNIEKLDWMNGVYMRALSVEDFTNRVLPFLEKYLPPEVERPLDAAYVSRIAPLIQPRINTLNDAAAYADFFFVDKLEYEASMLIGKKMTPEVVLAALKGAEEKLSSLESFDQNLLEDTLRRLAEALGIKAGQLFNPLRVATTAREAAPPLFETMAVLGKERCLNRIKTALAKLDGS